uniref:U5 small nuclear ribonucleoprotein 40 kDa protein n=1 Tax=Acrobeloides nanus TaxID=290746 RepID=A0A914EGF9_9BILA
MTDFFKRPPEPLLPLVATAPKRARFDDGALVQSNTQSTEPRTSSLMAPIMLLTGHEGEIYGAKFSPDGKYLASAGFDQKVLLWNVYGECENFSTFKGHNGAIMDVHFSSDNNNLFTCSVDKTVRMWDMEVGVCQRKFKSHKDFVNSCYPSRRGIQLVVSGSDDGAILVHDVRKRDPVFTLSNTNQYPVTAVTFNDTSDQIISGGIDNDIKIWDLRKQEVVTVLAGHSDMITGLALSPTGTHLLSNSMDCTARIWDVRPFVLNQQRCLKTLTGHQHNFEKNLLKCAWSRDSHRVACGSSDRFMYIWDVASRNIVYKLPGHQGSVNAVDFHPKEPIVLSASSDKRIYLGEIDQ